MSHKDLRERRRAPRPDRRRVIQLEPRYLPGDPTIELILEAMGRDAWEVRRRAAAEDDHRKLPACPVDSYIVVGTTETATAAAHWRSHAAAPRGARGWRAKVPAVWCDLRTAARAPAPTPGARLASRPGSRAGRAAPPGPALPDGVRFGGLPLARAARRCLLERGERVDQIGERQADGRWLFAHPGSVTPGRTAPGGTAFSRGRRHSAQRDSGRGSEVSSWTLSVARIPTRELRSWWPRSVRPSEARARPRLPPGRPSPRRPRLPGT